MGDKEEILPVGYPADVDPHFSVWTRPDLTGVLVLDPADPARYLSASDVWPLVGKKPAACIAQLGSAEACDDYDNAFAPTPVVRPEPHMSGAVPVWDDELVPPDWGVPIGDWTEPPPWFMPPPDPPAGAAGAAAELLGMKVILPDVPIGPTDGRFPNYDPTARNQGMVFAPVSFPFGLDSNGLLVSEMAANEPPIDVTDFALLAVPAGLQMKIIGRLGTGTGGAAAGGGGWTGRGGVETLYLFGGIDPSGRYGNRVWEGTRVQPERTAAGGGGDGTTARIVWREIRPALPMYSPAPRKNEDGSLYYPDPEVVALVPLGIVGAALAMDSSADRLFVLGGALENGYNEAVWMLNLRTRLWDRLPFSSGALAGRSRQAATFRGDFAYLYGGRNGGGPLAGLFRVDLRTLAVVRLDADDQPGPQPGPRSSASIQLTADGQRLLLYGGLTATGWTNDVWAFDLRTGKWNMLAPACDRGACPPAGQAAISHDDVRHRLVLAGASPAPRHDAYWIWNGSSWRAASDVVDAPTALDCDGDGVMDAGVQQACRNADAWWATTGTNECSRIAEAVECDAPDAAPANVTLLEQVQGGRLVVDGFGGVYALKHRHLRVFDAANAAHPRQTANVRLDGEGRDVLLHKEILYVATDAGVQAFSRANRLEPARLWNWSVGGGVDDVVADGRTLLLIESSAVRVVDISDPTYRAETAVHELVNVLPGVWAVDPPAPVRPPRGGARGSRRVAAFDGRTLALVRGRDMVVAELGADGSLALRGMVLLPENAISVRLEGRYAYTAAGSGDHGSVVWLPPTGAILVGTHDLESWADVATYSGDRAYRPAERGIEIAWY